MLQTKPKPTKAERTRQFIIESMSDVFNKKGYSKTSITDVEDITGLSRGAIYGNFSNKEEIAVAVFDHNIAKICSVADPMIREARTYYDKIMVFPQIYKAAANEFSTIGNIPILHTIAEAEGTNVLLKSKALKAILKKEQIMAELLQTGIQTGEFRRRIHPKEIASSILSSLEGGLMAARVTNDPARMGSINSSVEVLLRSILN
ncbi:transcriptional regulator, TetR family [Chitinophaga sp. YR627]|uniref:TetR/AcrR family transcriptional regulator n=1 Tax=Chitinophaga sp. YR627 TaxID=1881041 RepID=UPI0008F1C367|nr:TetR/AcrR family transcriptional regulator [Chitinophaga sp. YR627]SFN21454.1 transcriptional regulator, TetR family [Chitinophaga sp. YR627]